MRVTCLQENLARGLSVVGRAVATRSTLPILSNILVETDGARLKLTATNLETGIVCWIGARVEDEGAITVPARLMTDFVNSLPQVSVDLSLNAKTQSLNLKCDRYQADIKGIEASDFPILPVVDGDVRFQMEPDTLREMIVQASIAAASDESRPILTGVLVKADPDQGLLTLAAADGFRLSVRSVPLPAHLTEPLKVIVPARALTELSRISSDQSEPIDVALTENRNQIQFRLTDVNLVSQIIDGLFPDYQKIIPQSHTTRAVVNTRAMLNGVRIASFFAKDAANVVRLALEVDGGGNGTLRISAQSAEIGGNESEMEASIDGDPVEIAFNARYLMDMLNVAATEQVALELTTAQSPGVFKPVGDEDFTHVIMPMHIPRA